MMGFKQGQLMNLRRLVGYADTEEHGEILRKASINKPVDNGELAEAINTIVVEKGGMNRDAVLTIAWRLLEVIGEASKGNLSPELAKKKEARQYHNVQGGNLGGPANLDHRDGLRTHFISTLPPEKGKGTARRKKK